MTPRCGPSAMADGSARSTPNRLPATRGVATSNAESCPQMTEPPGRADRLIPLGSAVDTTWGFVMDAARPYRFPIISADSHITEPGNTYVDYIDPAYRD